MWKPVIYINTCGVTLDKITPYIQYNTKSPLSTDFWIKNTKTAHVHTVFHTAWAVPHRAHTRCFQLQIASVWEGRHCWRMKMWREGGEAAAQKVGQVMRKGQKMWARRGNERRPKSQVSCWIRQGYVLSHESILRERLISSPSTSTITLQCTRKQKTLSVIDMTYCLLSLRWTLVSPELRWLTVSPSHIL